MQNDFTDSIRVLPAFINFNRSSDFSTFQYCGPLFEILKPKGHSLGDCLDALHGFYSKPQKDGLNEFHCRF